MFIRLRTALVQFDWVMMLAMLVLLAVGLAMVWSVALSRDPVDIRSVAKQLVAAGVGLALFFGLAAANYRFIRSYALPITIGGASLLVAVLFFGQTIRGTTGWFDIGGWSFQPVELAKFALVIFLAKYFADHPRARFGWREFIISSLVAGGFVGLVLLEPDLGSALVLVATWIGLLALARIRKRYVIGLVMVLMALAAISWFFLAAYQQERILTFLDPGRDPLGRGYNVNQAVIAVGAGGLMGSGIGFGSQSQLRFLPESQTDFIFAVVAEELGFVGVLVVLGFISILLIRMFTIARGAPDDFTAFLVLGTILIITVQCVMNIGMNLGLLPVAGIGLPLLSYGGSSLVVFLAMLGVIQSIAAHRPRAG